jgi:toxic protein SymE
MADLHSNLDFTPAGTERQLIVGYRPHHGETSTPKFDAFRQVAT